VTVYFWIFRAVSVFISSSAANLPCRIVPTLEQVRSTSSNKCEDIRTVLPFLFLVNQLDKAVLHQRVQSVVGSSRMYRSGSPMKAQTIPTFCLVPLTFSSAFRPGSVRSAPSCFPLQGCSAF
jgi:hypothetical protein